MVPQQVTVLRLASAIKRLKDDKGSCDGCTAEMYKRLPQNALESLASFMTMILSSLAIPSSWTVVSAILLPKIIAAASLDKFRAIACLPASRKLLGYLWIQMLPSLRYESLQCGFVPKSHASNGVYVIKRAAELSREWKKSIFLAQLDLKKAFDKVRHSAVVRALRLQSASLQCIAVICTLLGQSTMAAGLGGVQATPTRMNCGLPQGAPESPLIFTLVTEMVLRPLLQKWRSEGRGWQLDELWLAAVCYADDIVLVSSSGQDLALMVKEIIQSFAAVGLEVGCEKTHWTYFPAKPDAKLKCGTEKIPWENSLTFIGTVLDLCGNDALAISHRTAQATKVYHKWRAVLQCPRASSVCRIRSTFSTFVEALLWLSETWKPTRKQAASLESWGARMTAQVMKIIRQAEETVGDFWRRLRREGHGLLKAAGGGINVRRRQRLHSFGGHLARDVDGLTGVALRTRSLAWWRACQIHGHIAHPGRSFPWRWEQQFADFYGEASSPFVDDNVGWMLKAQDRKLWKSLEHIFATNNLRH